MGERRYSSTILDLDSRWTRVVNFTPRPFYSEGKSARCPFDRLGGPQSHSGRYGEEKNLLFLQGIELQTCYSHLILHIKFCRLTLYNVWSLRSFVKYTYRQLFFIFCFSPPPRNLVLFYRSWVFQYYFTEMVMLRRLSRIYRNPLKHGRLNKIKNILVPTPRKRRCLHCRHQLVNAV
jgi:hypothetical protein